MVTGGESPEMVWVRLLPGLGMSFILTYIDDPTDPDYLSSTLQLNAETGYILTQTRHQSGEVLLCDAVLEGSTLKCDMVPALTMPARGAVIHMIPDSGAFAGLNIEIGSITPTPILSKTGTALSGSSWDSGQLVPLWYDGTNWRMIH